MAPEKRNTFLDANDSEEEDNNYDSEAEDLRKGGRGASSRSAKRRKVDDDASSDDEEEDDRFKIGGDFGGEEESDDAEAQEESRRIGKGRGKKSRRDDDDDEEEEEEEEDEEEDDDDGATRKAAKPKKAKSRSAASGDDDDDDAAATSEAVDLPGVSRPLTKKNLVHSDKAVRRSGVVYLSRIPPYMKTTKLRSLLSPYGAINRIFLSPEDPLSHARRVRGGGNKKRSFVDGWVEFVRKRDAQRAVDLLNAQTIGGKKGSYYRDDLWNLVYLRGFKWHHLTQQIATENAERASRMRAELAQTTRENNEFLQNVERAKMLEGMEAKAAAKAGRATAARPGAGETAEEGGGGAAASAGAVDRAAPPAAAAASAAAATTTAPQKSVRSFKQTKTVSRADKGAQPEHVQRVLSKIF